MYTILQCEKQIMEKTPKTLQNFVYYYFLHRLSSNLTLIFRHIQEPHLQVGNYNFK